MRESNLRIKKAIELLRSGGSILIYDADNREGETDIVTPARSITPGKVANLREDAGGLICVAIHPKAAYKLGLPFMTDLLSEFDSLSHISERFGDLWYDKRSSFSLWVNHRETFTGITDRDRALTIKGVGEVVDTVMNGGNVNFGRYFRSPGHVALLRAAEKLLDERKGQTELSIVLATLADVTPAIVLAEMLDSKTGYALSKSDAKRYALEHRTVFLEGADIIREYREHERDH